MRCRILTGLLRKNADAIIAINENTRLTLSDDLDVDIIQNSFTPKKLDKPENTFLEKLEGLRPSSLKVGFVGNLHVSKGIFDLLDAAKIVRATGYDVEYLIVGGVTVPDRGPRAWSLAKLGLAQNVLSELKEKIRDAGLIHIFHLLGPTIDIQRAYERMDVVTFPSHFDAPGRPVFEAAFSAVPAIVCVDNPRPDTLIDHETGIAIPMRNPGKLADAIIHFAKFPEEIKRMGANARKLAEGNFNPEVNAQKLLAVYRRVIGSASNRGDRVSRV